MKLTDRLISDHPVLFAIALILAVIWYLTLLGLFGVL